MTLAISSADYLSRKLALAVQPSQGVVTPTQLSISLVAPTNDTLELTDQAHAYLLLRDTVTEQANMVSLVQLTQTDLDNLASYLTDIQTRLLSMVDLAEDASERGVLQAEIDQLELDMSDYIGSRVSATPDVIGNALLEGSVQQRYFDTLNLGTALPDLDTSEIAVLEVDIGRVLMAAHPSDGCPICQMNAGTSDVGLVPLGSTSNNASNTGAVATTLSTEAYIEALRMSYQWDLSPNETLSYSYYDGSVPYVGYPAGGVNPAAAAYSIDALSSSLDAAYEDWDAASALNFQKVTEAEFQGTILDGSGTGTIELNSVNQLPSGSSDRTYAIWVKWDSSTSNGGVLIGHGTIDPATYYHRSAFLIVNRSWLDNEPVLLLDFQVGFVTSDAISELGDDNWHLVAATYSKNESGLGVRMYVDGEEVSASTGNNGFDKNYVNTINTASENLTFGYEYGTTNGRTDTNESDGFFSGSLDDAYVWDRALSAEEIASLFENPNSASQLNPISSEYLGDGYHDSATETTVGELRNAYTDSTQTPVGSAAYAFGPGTSSVNGDIWFDQTQTSNQNFTVGSYGYMTALHEIGHAIGLSHPFDGSSATGATLASALDYMRNTVMSYTSTDRNYQLYVTSGGSGISFGLNNPVYASTPMIYDVAAVEYMYGVSTTNAGDTSYTWSDAPVVIETLVDSGGNDTIDASNQTRSNIIDLTPGSFSSIGYWSRTDRLAYYQNLYGAAAASEIANFLSANDTGPFSDILYTGKDNIGIAFSATIENAIGGQADDTLSGNSEANSLVGGAGNDILYGGSGSRATTLGFTADPFPTGVTINIGGLSIVLNAGSSGNDVAEQVNAALAADTSFSNFTIERTDNTLLIVSPVGQAVPVFSTQTDMGGYNIDCTIDAPSGWVGGVWFGNNPYESALKLYGDRISGGSGDDTIDGGGGTNTAIFNGNYADYLISSSGGTTTVQATTGTDGTDTLTNVRYLEFADLTWHLTTGLAAESGGGGSGSNDSGAGSSGNATYVGRRSKQSPGRPSTGDTVLTAVSSNGVNILNFSPANRIMGSSGNDRLSGSERDDFLEAGAGNDVVMAGAGNDLIVGGSGEGEDLYVGGEGADTIRYSSAKAGITVNLQLGSARATSGGDAAGIGIDTLREIENIIGGHYDDLLIGDAADNLIAGNGGNDVVDGGAGKDTAVFQGARNSYTVKVADGGYVVTSASGEIARLANIEFLQFSDGVYRIATGSSSMAAAGQAHIGGISLRTQADASAAINTIDTALSYVNRQRSALGAVMNVLDARMKVLGTEKTNTYAARSRILDTDYANETAMMARQMIIAQAGQAMLAMANQSGREVLSLLR